MENLKKIRKQRGLTMKELGKLTDVSESMIQMLESGKRSPSFELLLKLGEALDCSVDELLDIKREPMVYNDETNVGDYSDSNPYTIREELRDSYSFRILYDAIDGASDADLLEAAALIMRRKEERERQ